MGEVYRAHDTKLSRDVALKILPEAFAEDPQRMGRFAREAQLLAALNHANIAAVHGLEEDGDIHALVMELVEGETLQERISRGSIPFDEAARIGLELAKAIEYAHEKGIVHRDLKPANIMLDAEGHVKVLDFGLAKALEEETSAAEPVNSPTLTAAATRAGIILGTAAYMSPEQAAGSSTDRRADVCSVRCRPAASSSAARPPPIPWPRC
jgi:serine/threonine-protein kinase